ncbi:MAG: amidase [Steroidobacteraceae bacterium]
MDRRQFLAAGLAVGAVATDGARVSQAAVHDAGVEEAGILALQGRMEAGSLTSRELVGTYLARMEALDGSGPSLRSVIERNPEALAVAGRLDAERATRGPRGPLHGIPILVKDNIDTADGMANSAGSLALADSRPRRDAGLIERLRAAGAVLLGKTNLSEWANFRSTRSSSGWSGRGGQTLNPYALDRSPCGSSSGSGAATAANLCAASVGTETDGSIVCPAKACGLVGLKPTVGLISRSGIIPISATQDTAGPMTRTVEDAALMLAALAGRDRRDTATSRIPGAYALNFQRALRPDALRFARLGVVRSMFGDNPMVAKVMETALTDLSRLGAELVDVETRAHREVGEAEWLVLQYEFKAGLNDYLASLGPMAPIRSLAEIIDFNQREAAREMPWFGQEIFELCEQLGGLDSTEYLEALATCRRLAGEEGIDLLLGRHHLDALIAPTGDPAFTIDLVNGDHYTGGGTSTLAAVAGYPHITVPMGQVSGLPVGLSLFAGAWSEAKLLDFAYTYEQATRHRQPPRFRTSIGTN